MKRERSERSSSSAISPTAAAAAAAASHPVSGNARGRHLPCGIKRPERERRIILSVGTAELARSPFLFARECLNGHSRLRARKRAGEVSFRASERDGGAGCGRCTLIKGTENLDLDACVGGAEREIFYFFCRTCGRVLLNF